MNVTPVYTTIGSLFESKPLFVIPKYQRGYAWETSEIDDFLKDLKDAVARFRNGQPSDHFFGGIVSISRPLDGANNLTEYELIDGQQRLATFVLLMATIIRKYEQLKTPADTNSLETINNRISELKPRFVEFRAEINKVWMTKKVLCLSRADNDLFQELIKGSEVTSLRESHTRLLNASNEISSWLRKVVDQNRPSLTEKLNRLKEITDVVETKFNVLHLKTSNHNDAFRLFQILNDRGKSLTEGELLRAKTLELLEGFQSQQESVELIWDEILKDKPKSTEDYLRWIYSSHRGGRPGKGTLYDDFLEIFFPQHALSAINQADAESVVQKMQEVRKDVAYCRQLISGEWPFPIQLPITGWDRDRLVQLVKTLDHTLCMPLLLAGTRISAPKFSMIVKTLVRFTFRYITMLKQHVGALQKIYHEECTAIHRAPDAYNPNSLKVKLQNLQRTKAGDAQFLPSLENLEYSKTISNKITKYFLMELEYHWLWYDRGAVGEPKCLENNLNLIDLDNTLEHIYPFSATPNWNDPDLELVKNKIGNLTLLSQPENQRNDDKNYQDKMLSFVESSLHMNKAIGLNANWTLTEHEARTEYLGEMAKKIFSVDY